MCLLALARPCWPLFALEMFPCYIIVTVAHRPAAVSSLATKRPVSPLFPPCALALHLASLAPSRPYRAHGGMCSEAPCCLSPSLSTALPAAYAAAPCHRRLLKNAVRGVVSRPHSLPLPVFGNLFQSLWLFACHLLSAPSPLPPAIAPFLNMTGLNHNYNVLLDGLPLGLVPLLRYHM